MRIPSWCASAFGLALLLVLPVGSAHAQATRTWVSGVGDDVNPCSRTAPCKTFAGAISKTAVNGEINCLDPGGFGAVTITKSISIICLVEAGVLVSGTNGIVVSNSGASTINVVLAGLDIEGLGTGINGVTIIGSGPSSVTIKNCTIHGFTTNGVNVAGPTSTRAVILDTYIALNNTNGVAIAANNTAVVIRS
ncbi:MAG TPA: right-handed parallel beta-helix repeat-containing protein, partial [Pseudolabrys sp.]|nr:right-handed parallel beta-helix repeat-containing protein [Pseudolabrys sp.]